ncbi:MAG: cell division protein ZapA [Planktomarina sp.]|mgnify:FL=1|jgi:cell division protein ZapA|nr:cell division protein ZapA [Planktomarina sp.]
MPEVTIKIGQRPYTVNCPAGEEPQLQKAREALDAEASSLLAQVGRVPEAQMLLMSGLMLADRTLALQDQLRQAQEALEQAQRSAHEIAPEIKTVIKEVEVPVVPPALLESLAELSARAEAAADDLEERLAQSAG